MNESFEKNGDGYQIDFQKLTRILFNNKKYFGLSILIGCILGASIFGRSKKKFSAEIFFVKSNSEQSFDGLSNLGILGGGLGAKLNVSESPLLEHFEKYVYTREFINELKLEKFNDSTLYDIFSPSSNDSLNKFETFYSTLKSKFEIKKKDGMFSFKVESSSPEMSCFLANKLFLEFKNQYQLLKIKNMESNLNFLNQLVARYEVERSEAKKSLQKFMEANHNVTSPYLMEKQNDLILNVRLAEEKYVLSIKEKESAKIKNEKKQEELIVIQNPYLDKSPSNTSLRIYLILFSVLTTSLCLITIALLNFKNWVYFT